MNNQIVRIQIWLYSGLLFAVLATAIFLPGWAIRKPAGTLNNPIPNNHDLLYFVTDAPDTFIIYSPGLNSERLLLPASERMSDIAISPDGTTVWTATKSGFVDRYKIPVDESMFGTQSRVHSRIAPVLSAIALSSNQRFFAVGYGNSEDYNSRNIKILPADMNSILLEDEVADFSVSGDIQDIVANPARDLFYIINSHSDRVRIYNADTLRLESDILELGNSPGRFLVRPDGLFGYGAMNARNAVAVADLTTNEMIEYISCGFPPYAMAFNADGSHLYVASRDSAIIAVLDTNTNRILTTFTLPPRIKGLLEFNFAEEIGISSDEKYLYVLPKRAELVVYDISKVLDPAHQGEQPTMIQTQIFAQTPFAMEVIRGHQVPGVPTE